MMAQKPWAITDGQYGQLCGRVDEFKMRVRKGVIPFEAAMDHLQAAFDGNMSTSRDRKNRQASLTSARRILFYTNVYLPEQICPKWNLSEISLPIRYREQTLREAAESNKKGETDFHLVYFPGEMSLFRQREIRGTDSAKPPYFNSGNNWWLANEEKACREKQIEYWPKISSPAGFYLLDLKYRFANLNWQAQEDEIAKLGAQYERAPEDVFLFAAQSIYMLTGKNVTGDWWHWGKTLDSGGDRGCVYLYGGGLAGVSRSHPGYSHGGLRVSLSRKFEF